MPATLRNRNAPILAVSYDKPAPSAPGRAGRRVHSSGQHQRARTCYLEYIRRPIRPHGFPRRPRDRRPAC